jgi:alpha-glucosidase
MITNTDLHYKGNLFPGKVVRVSKDVDTYVFKAENAVTLRVQVLRDSMIRFRYAVDGNFENDFSYAIADNYTRGFNSLVFKEEKEYYELTTSKLIIRVSHEDMRVGIYELDGSTILEDELGFHWEENHAFGGEYVKMSKFSPDGENFYGLGDKPMHSNLKGKRVENWNTDEYAFGKDRDPIYKTVPFYIGLKGGTSYGIFFDNTFKSHFDFAAERRNVCSFWADGGEMNYYFIYGPEMKEVVKTYTNLTGVPELPPLWVLGYHQCKWSYYPEEKFVGVAKKFRELNIPCDAMYLDIDYMEGFRCFTWNKEYFPDPKRMVKELEDDGFKTVVIIDPGIKIDPEYDVYSEALKNDYFCKRSDGPLMKGKVWPGECNFPDFTKPVVRDWWRDLYKELIEDIGVRGVWNDMNEPAVMEIPGKTFPLDVRHDYDGNPCSHRKAHNVYGMQMARASYEGVKKYAYPKRPFLITRAAYSGTQRYTSSWTGDNVASWEHLWLANIQVQRMNLSGMGFTGTDIGGFAEQPTPELYARWVQLGVFHPFCRTHSSGHHGEQEPWSFGEEVLNVVRSFIELRYTLLPYIYTMFWEYVKYGKPMIKPLYYVDQEDSQTHYRTDEFLFGDSILVCPILEANASGRRMYMPRGKWVNFWTGEEVVGGKEVWVDATLETIPVFVKSGSAIPRYPVQQYVGEKVIDELGIDVYYTEGSVRSKIYTDSGDGYDYAKGRYSLRNIHITGRKNDLVISQHKDGDYDASYKRFKLNIHNLPFEVKSVYIDNERAEVITEKLGGNTFLVVDKDFGEIHITGK